MFFRLAKISAGLNCWRPDTLYSYCICWDVIFHARGVDLGVSVADNCHPSPHLFLDEQVLVNIIEKVQFNVHYLKNSLPGQTRGSVIMGLIKTTMLETHVSEILKHIRQ